MAPCHVFSRPRIASPASQHSGFHGQRICAATVQPARSRVAQPVRAGLTEVGSYLADAAKQVFSPAKSNSPPNWQGSGSGFSGKVTHHDTQKLRDLYSMLRQARVGITGCMDPKAGNYDPQATSDDGTCVFIAEDGTEVGRSPDLRNYVSTMLERVWGGAVANDRAEGTFKGSGYPFSGDIVSRRDIERLMKYEKIVKEELEKAEAQS